MVSSMASHFLRRNDREGHALGREILRHKAAAVLRRHALQQTEGIQSAKAVKHAAGEGDAHVVKVLQPAQTRAQRGAARPQERALVKALGGKRSCCKKKRKEKWKYDEN